MTSIKSINDNKKFWKNVKPFFANKNKGNKTIALEEGNKMITDDGKLAQILMNILWIFFQANVSLLFKKNNDNAYNDNIDNIIKKFQGHPRIVDIKGQMKKYNKSFTF